MNRGPLILTYHAIQPGPPPLCIPPQLFRAHLDCLVAQEALTLTISEVRQALRSGELPERAVCLTFDDGAASVARAAAPLLAERRLAATIFCVAGFLGGRSSWPSVPGRVEPFDLLSAGDLVELHAAGLEIGSHGFEHAPLGHASPAVARREIVDSGQALEQVIGAPVTSFACPYADPPGPAARELIRETYEAAFEGRFGRVGRGSDPFSLPRVDIHYLRRPELLRRALSGSLTLYLGLRMAGAQVRRLARKDYVPLGAV